MERGLWKRVRAGRAADDRPLWRRLTADFGTIYLGIVWIVIAAWVLRLGESFPPLWALSSALNLLLLPAWAVGVAAVVLRRRLIAVAALATVIAQLLIAWPMLPWGGGVHHHPAGLEIASLNLYVSNPHLPAAMREIATDPPPVLVLEEFTPAAQLALHRSALARHYRYVVERAEAGTTGMAVLSATIPVHAERLPAGASDEMEVELATSPTPLRIVAVHTFGPQPGDASYWERSIHGLDRALDQLHGRWVAIGDFNATDDHRVFRDLLHGGRHDAHLETGRGYARSWPADRPFPALVLIDHCLLGPGMRAMATSERTIAGSDHRMIDVVLSA